LLSKYKSQKRLFLLFLMLTFVPHIPGIFYGYIPTAQAYQYIFSRFPI
jgi:hypothetical protein